MTPCYTRHELAPGVHADIPHEHEGVTVNKSMAEVLSEHAFHQIMPVDLDDVNGPWEVECNCGADPIQGPSFLAAEVAFAAHQEAMLTAAGFGPVKAAAAGNDWPNVSRLAPKFWNRIDVREKSSCWKFDGPALEFGHGRYDSPAGFVAHRYAWALANGRLPHADEVVRHKCDNPICCNPEHLVIGSQADNVTDMIERDRGQFRKGHCRKGHEMTPDNVTHRSNGERRCRRCASVHQKERRTAQPDAMCPECSAILKRDSVGRHRKSFHGVSPEAHRAWLRARAATIEGSA